MRYFSRRYGEYYGFGIPDVLPLDRVPGTDQTLTQRRQGIYETENIVVVNAVNKLNSREFVKSIVEIRLRFPNKLVYLPFFGLPNDYPVLFYLGIDLLDESALRLLGDETCVTEFGNVDGTNCLERNLAESRRVLDLIRLSLENGRFRELVESHSFSTFSKEALRIVDMEYKYFSDYFLDLRPRRIVASNVEGLHRPEIANFRERAASIRQTADNLLLIPCSATKPYSLSKTHRILRSLIGRHLGGIQEVIVTSPLGLVPRELEAFFPAKYYDIPVTGHWFEEEKIVLETMAAKLFEGKKYNNVFFILPKGESGIVKLFETAEGIEGNLNYLNSEKLSKTLDNREIKGDWKKKEKAEFSNVIRYYWDLNVDPGSLSVKNEGNRRLINVDGKQYFVKTISGIRMLEALGRRLLNEGKRVIEVENVFKGGNVFLPGIRKVSGDVRPGMEVVLAVNGEPVGRGISQISEYDLLYEKRGIGVEDVSYF